VTEYLQTTVDKFTFRVATDRLYSHDGLWVLRLQPHDGTRVRIGVSDYLQQHSGDTTFVTVQPVGTKLTVGDLLADYETFKASLALASPVSGSIISINEELEMHPELVNQSPYEKGWLAELDVTDGEAGQARLLDAQAYFAVMQAQVEAEVKKQ
jgi:glycine cleavage system H protein